MSEPVHEPIDFFLRETQEVRYFVTMGRVLSRFLNFAKVIDTWSMIDQLAEFE